MGLHELDDFRPEIAAPAQRETAIACRGVGVRYRMGSGRDDVKSRVQNLIRGKLRREEHWALRGLDLTVASGEIVGVIGRNGAGKSTLCRVLTRILRPDEGSVRVAGEVSALLTYGTGFDLRLTGRENVYRAGMMLGMTKQRVADLYDEIVDFAGIGEFIEQPMKTYSLGMRARLGFSVAACLEPDVLIVDEALSVGDLEFFERASKKIQEVIATCKLVIVVTHRLEFVERVCSRAVWIEQGAVRVYGLPADVLAAYRAAFPKPPKPATGPKRITTELHETKADVGERVVVEAKGLGVRYRIRVTETDENGKRRRERKDHWALRGVDFALHEGDILGVIGPNGAGKTTLCKTLAGILRPEKGSLRVDGEITALLTFGTGFHPQLSGRDNVYRNGMMLGMPKRRIRELFDEIVEFAGIGKWIDEPVKNYSNGMRSRLGFSVAAILRPSVFIIDEAMNAGDADFYSKAAAKIQEMITRAQAVVVVTHNLAFVERVCTRAIWLQKGQLVHDGTPEDTVARYRNAVHRKIEPKLAPQ